MEPFHLTIHEVTSDESDSSNFDSFSNVVNYETYFDQTATSLPLGAYNVNTVQYCWKDYTYPATTSTQTSTGSVSTGPDLASVHHQPVWGDTFQDSPPHQTFLVHPDDSLSTPRQLTPTTSAATVTIAQLQVLAQVSSNTSAVVKGGKRTQRFVARTVTSPSTPIPPSGIMSHQTTMSTTFDSGAVNASSPPPVSSDTQDQAGDEDNSFETVAEALRLQWSVIGNKTLTPVSPDVVAQIVAEAERKMKTGNTSPLSTFSSSTGPSPIPLVQTEGSPAPGNSVADLSNSTGSLPIMLQEVHHSSCPRDLRRIIPKDITKEKTQSVSWFSSGSKNSKDSVQNSIVGKTSSSAAVVSTAGTLSSHTVTQSHNVTVYSSASKSPGPFVDPLPNTAVATDPASTRVDNSDTVSEASYSSEVEIEKYLQGTLASAGISANLRLESEEFLRSLPPIKPINLEAYAAVPLLPPKLDKFYELKQKSLSVQKTESRVKKKSSTSANFSSESPDRPTGNNLFSSPLSSTPSSKVSGNVSGAQGSTAAEQYDSFSTLNLSTSWSPSTASADLSFSKKQFDEVLREKARLQGQLEILTDESQTILQERAELQAQLASLKSKLATLQGESFSGGDSNLKKEVENLRLSRKLLEQTIMDANRMLSEKAEEIRALQDELQVAQDAANKLQVRSQEMRDDIRAKDMNVQALKNKIAELYVEVQTSIQSKMEAESEARTSRNDLMSLVKAKEWYQEQLQLAHDVRAKLQRELTILQAQAASHGTIVERLKTDSARLRHQLTDTQQRALQDKELLARHLEAIQSDMTEREAAFMEIQRERKLYEDTFNYQATTVEEEKSRLALLQQATNDLEAQLDRASSEAKKRHQQLLTMETGQIDVLKRLAVSEETLGEKDKSLAEMEEKLIQVESQLQALMSDLTKREEEILKLKEEKANTEIALKSALQEKVSVDKALEVLKGDMGKVEQSFKQMKQELNQRLADLQVVKAEKDKLQEELDHTQTQLEIKVRSVDALTRDFDGRSTAEQEMRFDKARLEEEIHGLQQKVQRLEYELNQKELRLAAETDKNTFLTNKLSQLEIHLEQSKNSVPAAQIKIYESEIEDLQLRVKVLEEAEVEQASVLEFEKEKMQAEITRLRSELLERQQAYEKNVELLDSKLKELVSEKQQLETELGIAQQSVHLTQLEERDSVMEEIMNLREHMRVEQQERHELEQRLISLQASKAAEIEALQMKLQAQNDTLQSLQSQQALLADYELTNQRLELELEKEKGRVMGLSQTNLELKEHSHQLEMSLAQRQSALETLTRSVQESSQELEQRDYKFLDRISGLEEALEKECEIQRELRKQMGSKIMENKRLKKQCDAIRQEVDQLRQDLNVSQQAATQALADLDTANKLSQTQLAEARENTAQAKLLEVELERAQRELNDNLAKQPVLMEQIQSLQWQFVQKAQEADSAREQIKMVEERTQADIEAAKASLQEKQLEIDRLQAELTSLRQEKKHQRSQVNELRGALKASVQHHKLTKRLNENEENDKSVQANFDRKLVIPPLPFDIAAIEQLIENTRVTHLQSKPLDQLTVCLSSLRAEISGLQKQMDRHTSVVHLSTQSWRSVQKEVNDLNEVMRTVANTVIAANSTQTTRTTSASDREPADILHV